MHQRFCFSLCLASSFLWACTTILGDDFEIVGDAGLDASTGAISGSNAGGSGGVEASGGSVSTGGSSQAGSGGGCALGTTDHCGACDRACDGANVDGLACADGVCSSTCETGFANCNRPSAPDADDGCEADLASAATCGDCDTQCDTATGAASCEAGVCSYTCDDGRLDCDTNGANANGCETDTNSVSTCGGCNNECDTTYGNPGCDGTRCVYDNPPNNRCNAGRVDCDTAAPNLNGCECETDPTIGGCCDTACQTKHSNGLGQSFFDCVAPFTYNAAQAVKARNAWTLSVGAAPDDVYTGNCGAGGSAYSCAAASYGTLSAGSCAMWCYSGPNAGDMKINTQTNECWCIGQGIGTEGEWD